MKDPMERMVAEALTKAGIRYDTNPPSALDFDLLDVGIQIEVKQFHSDRIAQQTARVPNVIVVQGVEAVRFFCSLLMKEPHK